MCTKQRPFGDVERAPEANFSSMLCPSVLIRLKAQRFCGLQEIVATPTERILLFIFNYLLSSGSLKKTHRSA